MDEFKTLVDCKTLASLLGEDGLVLLDGTWFLPNVDRDAQAEYRQQHIPGAQFFDIDATSDQKSSLPHMLPSGDAFSAAAEALGISNHSRIVVYDAQGLFSAARVWWMFRLFGHQQVAVLDGGLPAWLAEGHAVTNRKPEIETGVYRAEQQPDMAVDLQGMRNIVRDNSTLILDARSAGRFVGEAPEPRPELQSGHMPGACSLPAPELLSDGKLKPVAELRSIFETLSVNAGSSVVTSCGSGVTAAIITLAMTHCGLGTHQLYDGSWTEWASVEGNPIVKGT